MQRERPHSADIEEHVLGACFYMDDITEKVVGYVGTRYDMFAVAAHRWIYEAIYRAYQDGKSIDPAIIQDKLGKKIHQVGGFERLLELTNITARPEVVDSYLNIINDYHLRREIILGSGDVVNAAYDDENDVEEVITLYSSVLDRVSKEKYHDRSAPIQDIIQDALEVVEQRMANPGIHGVPTGFALDKYTGGWQDGSFYVIGARPSIGKTALVLQSAYHGATIASKEKRRAGYYWNGEMLNRDMVARLIALESGVNYVKMRDGNVTPDEFSRIVDAAGRVHNASLEFDDTPGIGIHALRSKYKTYCKAHDGDTILYVDYLQLMSGHKEGNREQEISSIARGLKEIALETQTPVIALSQLSRECLKRNYCQPQLGDLRESGSLEQDADGVILLNRPEFFGYDTYKDKPSKDLGIISVAKMRQGMVGDIGMRFNKTFAEWQNPVSGMSQPNNNPSPESETRGEAIMPHTISLDDDDQPF